ncbi:MAG: bifunctional hydroxymethylpyrimidine kinase/phosphomethylpyrimidine kinase [Verrucomicrobiaceae bacterium]|nr:bifunctional hydroxymethylpyrimidine kinase/phosphomethylpyrimidine kinase [Verrucomicrobiaceae bacterium]
MSLSAPIPVVMSVAGSDSSAGAGIQADLKSIAAQGGYGLCAVTNVVSEIPGKVSKVCLMEPEMIEDQMRVLLAGFPVAAAKTGMLGGAEQVRCVARVWKEAGNGRPLVVDPVMVATGGGRLLEEGAVQAVSDELLPLAAVITPNMDEATVLWGRDVRSEDDMLACAEDLAKRYETAVLLKGGHLEGEAADVLVVGESVHWYRAPRVQGVHTHGTGCSLSAAIAAQIALGKDIPAAVGAAKRWLSQAVAGYLKWIHSAGEVHALNHLNQS